MNTLSASNNNLLKYPSLSGDAPIRDLYLVGPNFGQHG